jgi:hypothetical protein
MAQIVSTLNNGISNGIGESALVRGVRRSRFSLHFKTPKTRRWLLVQWVSAPVQATGEWLDNTASKLTRERTRPNLASLLDQHQMQSALRRTF